MILNYADPKKHMLAATARPLELSAPTPEDSHLARVGCRRLVGAIGEGPTAKIRVINSDEDIAVPVTALRLLVDILAQMAQGNAVAVVPIHAEYTTQQAADFLNVSRPFLIGLLEEGNLPFRKVGTHRRIRFEDLVKYRAISLADQKAAADELARQAQEIGLGY